jgi:hypothetical protein
MSVSGPFSREYWDYLACLDRHPDFKSDSEYAQDCTTLFSRGLCGMAAQGTFELRPSAEAKERDARVAAHPAVSRLLPIQDGLDYWEEHRSSAGTGLGGPAPG